MKEDLGSPFQESLSYIEDIFDDQFVFTIPVFQRPYVWNKDHAKGLIIGLLKSVDDSDSDLEKLPPHFLGTILLSRASDFEVLIVDGQQRLVTLKNTIAVLCILMPHKYTQDLVTISK